MTNNKLLFFIIFVILLILIFTRFEKEITVKSKYTIHSSFDLFGHFQIFIHSLICDQDFDSVILDEMEDIEGD